MSLLSGVISNRLQNHILTTNQDKSEEQAAEIQMVKLNGILKVLKGLLILSAIPLFLLTYHMTSSIYYDIQLNAGFQKRIRILAPHITENQEEILISDWAQMKNRNDYLIINAKLEKYASANNIILPELLLQ